MYCGTCGKELPDGAKFCNGCGAAQPNLTPESQLPKAAPEVIPVASSKAQKPKKEKKKVNKKLLAVVAIVLVVALVASIVIPILFPRKVTVYVLTSYSYTESNGEVRTYEYEYDERGNPLQWFGKEGLYVAKYDEYGNLKQEGFYINRNDSKSGKEYKYTYDKNGRIETCREYALGKKRAKWEFTWDKKGNLIQAQIADYESIFDARYPRVDFVYDNKGRLFQEYYFLSHSDDLHTVDCYAVYLYEYSYDKKGNLLTIQRGESEETVEDYENADPEEISFNIHTIFELEYDEESRLISLEECYRDNIYEYSYDKDGNYIDDSNAEYIYDEHGNLLRIEYEDGSITEYTYEAMEMTHEAAQRYRSWENIYRLNPKERMLYPAAEYFHPGNRLFFYYLVPCPIW